MTTANTTTTKKAFALSLAFHTFMALCALGILYTAPSRTEALALPIKHITIVSLSQAPTITPPTTVPITPKTQKVLPETPRPQPVVQPKPVPLKSPAPLPDAPAAKPSAEPLPTASTADTKPEAAPAAVQIPAQSPVKAQKIDIGAEMNAFKASLRSRIQQQLRYPPAARRRGMEGSVTVHFLLEPSGTIRNITVSNGEGIFHNAAKLAVASASGIKVPDTLSGSLPTEMNILLEFNLKNGS